MKRLFSPWRSSYIASFKNPNVGKGCLFCRIAKEKKDEKNLVVWRGEHCFLVMNLYPYNSGHLMVIPYKHTADLGALSVEAHAEIMQTTVRAMKALGRTSAPQGFNVGANLGRIAGAGIDKHIHFHIVPRWNGDTNFMPVLADVKLISEDMKHIWSNLRRALQSGGKK
ncbi:MAG TPA: HIT domain-containing protein [Bacteroidota bacterium]|nr:HIT domain-containing protein [Bacteroidota bacterium]